MKNNSKSILNLLFPLFTIAGGILIFNQSSEMSLQQMLLPTGLVAFYALWINASQKDCSSSAAEYYSDSIYFLGFLYTLMALVTLFFQLNEAFEQNLDFTASLFSLIGVSVTTSIAGVLFRNMSRASFMKKFPADEDNLHESTKQLADIAASLAKDQELTVSSIQSFLKERESQLSQFNDKERQYLDSLDQFSVSTKEFCQSLSAQSSALQASVDAVVEANSTQKQEVLFLIDSITDSRKEMKRFSKEASTLDLEQLGTQMSSLGQGTKELDAVLDSMITILNEKVEKVPL